MGNEPLRIKRKADDGTRLITVRLPEELLREVDKIADDAKRSRNELINLILDYGIKNIEIE